MDCREVAVNRPLRVLMMSHLRRYRAHGRPFAMARHMAQRGHDVSLIVTADRRKFGIVKVEREGVQVVEIPDLLWGKLRSGWDFWNLLNRIVYLSHDRSPYDVVHLFETRPATIYPALYYLRHHHTPFVTDWNDWWGRGGIIEESRPGWYRLLFGGVETYYEEAFRAQANGLTVICTALAERARGLGVPPERICHIPGGAFPNLMPMRNKEACCQHVGLPASIPVLGYSSIESRVEFDFLMQVLVIVAQRCPEVRLLMTGKPSAEVLKVAHKYGIVNNLYLPGFLPFSELSWYLGCSDVFMLPFPDKTYNVGRWPNKIGDYLCLGRPMVTNPVGDVKHLIEEHNVGVLADWDPADFAEKIFYLLENPDSAAQLGENARRAAVEHFNWTKLIGQLESFYYRLLGMEQQTILLPVNSVIH